MSASPDHKKIKTSEPDDAAPAGEGAVAGDGNLGWEGTGLTPQLFEAMMHDAQAAMHKQQPLLEYPVEMNPKERFDWERKQVLEFRSSVLKKAFAPLDFLLRLKGSSVDKLFDWLQWPEFGYPPVSQDCFKHPKDVNGVVKYVKRAIAGNGWVRCRGSGHSYPMNITANQPYTTMKGYKGANIAISLNKINYVNIDKATKTCRVGAGCYLGKNPDDPSSTWENSLLQQLYDAGLGLTVLGGISHQSVAGFLLTGSAGGSLYHATSDMVIGFTFVDGQGNVRTCSETENPEWFAAMGVSMGLLGIVTEVQLQCVDNFNIIEEYHVKDVTPDWFNPSSPDSAVQQLANNEYMRFNWWPQNMPNKEMIEIWKARKMTPEDYKQWGVDPQKFTPNPWLQFPDTVAGDIMKFVSGLALQIMDIFAFDSGDLMNFIFVRIVGPILCFLQPYMVQDPGPLPKDYTFWDTWYQGLPMDNRSSPDVLFCSYWCEIWLTPEQASDALKTLDAWFVQEGISVTGPFEWEVYSAKKSKFWMSPSFDGDKIRLDILWLHNWFRPRRDPKTAGWYPKIWDVLSKYNFQPHWGKFIPDATGPQGTVYMKKNFTKWDAWMNVRQQLDPDQFFVTDYWRAQLAIPPKQ